MGVRPIKLSGVPKLWVKTLPAEALIHIKATSSSHANFELEHT
jgi:hypothetical protein